MARSATTLDSFAAIAEPKRRRVLDLLMDGERPVQELTLSLRWTQPQVSKHLGVLKEVGLVRVRKEGRQRMYSLNGDQLKPVHDWVKSYERFWTHSLLRIKQRAEAAAAADKNSSKDRSKPHD
jgi:DNA-binding transcriptional ArsR family regulator